MDNQQNLVKRLLLSNLLQTISKRLVNTNMPGDRYMSGEDFKKLIDYFHYLGGSSNLEPSLPTYIAENMSTYVFDQIKSYGSSISNSSNPELAGLTSLRDFVKEQYPIVATILANLAPDYKICLSGGGNCFFEDGWISDAGIEIIRQLFQGDPHEFDGSYSFVDLHEISQILPLNLLPNDELCDSEISDDEKQLSTAIRAINKLYYDISDYIK